MKSPGSLQEGDIPGRLQEDPQEALRLRNN